MFKSPFHSIALAATAGLVILLLQVVTGADLGTLKCKDGSWIPDAKVIGFGITCPLPLDGKSKTKGKTCLCAMKKLGVYDGTTIQKDKIAPELCAVFKPDDMLKQCKTTVTNCLKDSKDYFKDVKSDTEYKSWAQPYECVEKWVKKACKKTKKA